MQYRRRLFAVVAVLAVSAVARAEQPVTTNRLQEVVVTATRIPETTETTPASVTIITHDQLVAQQSSSVAEALRGQAGVAVTRTGQPGQQTSVFLRGANSDNTLVLMDGIRVNNGFNNAFDFATLPADNVERIEIIRGPQSALYGSEALGGVINIITRKHAGAPTGAVSLEGGSYDSLHPRGWFVAPIKTGNVGVLTLAGDGGYFTTANARPNSYDRAANGSGRLTWETSERFSASASKA